jgi:hypothetical protein
LIEKSFDRIRRFPKGTFFEVGPLGPAPDWEPFSEVGKDDRIAELSKRLLGGADEPTDRIFRYLAQAPEDPEQSQSASIEN